MLGFFLASELAAFPEVPTPHLDCRNNQQLIVSALWAHALENRIPPDRTVLLANLAVYFKDNRIPTCPLGGRYPVVLTTSLKPLDVDKTPICSLGGPEQHLQRASERRESEAAQRARWLVVAVAIVILSPLLIAWRRRLARAGTPPSDAGD